MEKRYEEHAYVLDFLPHGRPGFRASGRAGYRAGALIQCVGEEFFTLLEALVKEQEVGALVVGLPLTLDGSESAWTRTVRAAGPHNAGTSRGTKRISSSATSPTARSYLSGFSRDPKVTAWK